MDASPVGDVVRILTTKQPSHGYEHSRIGLCDRDVTATIWGRSDRNVGDRGNPPGAIAAGGHQIMLSIPDVW